MPGSSPRRASWRTWTLSKLRNLAVRIQPRRQRTAQLPTPSEGILLTHLTVSDDVERSRRFYTDVLGGETVFHGARLRAVQAQLEAEDTARLLLCGNLASDGDA